MSVKDDDVFDYDATPAGTYNDHDGWRPWVQRHEQATGSSGKLVTADPRKGTGMRQWAAPKLEDGE